MARRLGRLAIAVGGFLALGSELLSLLRLFSFWPVLILWMPAAIGSFLAIRRWLREDSVSVLALLKQFRFDEGLVLSLIVGLAACALVLGLFFPPHSWDSMVYHLPRQVHWIQQGSLVYFPTSIPYQLFRGTYAETLQASLQLLTRTDLTVQLVSWAALVLCLLYVGLIAGEMGASRRGRLLSALIALCVPIAFLEALTTKNDLLVSAWSLAAIWLVIRGLKARRVDRIDALLIGLALGLAGLTKSSAYLLLAPLIPVLGFLLLRLRHRIACGLLVVAAFSSINAAHWERNLASFGAPLGPTALTRMFFNETMSPARFISRLARESSLEVATPFLSINRQVESKIRGLHDLLGVDVLDPATTFPGRRFEVNFLPNNEYQAGAPLQFAGLILLPIGGLIFRRRLAASWWLAALLPGAMFCWLCLTSKWEPYLNPRLHILIFMIAAPALALLVDILSEMLVESGALRTGSTLFLLAGGLFALQIYPSLKSSALSVLDPLPRPRSELLFSEGAHLRPLYEQTAALIRSLHPAVLGIDSRGDWAWEYPLMRLVRRNLYEPAFVSVNPSLVTDRKYRTPDVVVVLRPVETYTDHQSGRSYRAVGHFGFMTVLR